MKTWRHPQNWSEQFLNGTSAHNRLFSAMSGGMLAWLSAWGADLHIAQQMPLPLTISCSSKSRLVLTLLVLPFWYLLTRVDPDIFQTSSKTVVCVCVCAMKTKLEVHNISQCCQRRTKLWPEATRGKKLVKFSWVVFELWDWTDKQTYSSQYFAQVKITYYVDSIICSKKTVTTGRHQLCSRPHTLAASHNTLPQ